MKKLLQVGEQLDINAAYDGGAVDSSVQYSVPVSMQDVITVDSAGVVSAVSEGTAVVEIKDTSGNLLRSVVFDVLSAADFAVQSDLDSGAKDLSIESVNVPQGPPPSAQISLNTMTSANQGGYLAFSNDNIAIQGLGTYLGFDGQVYPGWVPIFYVPNPGDSQKFGQILPTAKTLTRYEIINNANTMIRKWRIEGSADTTTGFDGTWTTLDEKTDFNSWNSNIGEVYNFDVVNTVAYKAYRIVGLHNPIAPGNQWRCPELVLYGY